MSRRRRIKRDLASIPKKGVAGLRLGGLPPTATSGDAAVPSTSQQFEENGTESGIIEPRRTSNNSNDSLESLQNDLDESNNFLLRHHHGNVENDSDDDNTGLASGINTVDERDINCDDSEVNSAAYTSGDDNETDLETQLSELLLQ